MGEKLRELKEWYCGKCREECYLKYDDNTVDPKGCPFGLFAGVADWKLINTPKHETVEEWETRTGESYPDDAPVYIKNRWVDMEEIGFKCMDYLHAKKYLSNLGIYIANHYGKPEIGDDE